MRLARVQLLLVAGATLSLAGCEGSGPAPITRVVEEPTKPSVDAKLAAFVPHLNEYLAFFPNAPSFHYDDKAAYIRGKLITVRVDMSLYDAKVDHEVISKGQITPTFLDLPTEIRADSPAEVQTIVRLRCENYMEGTYRGAPGGGYAGTESCSIEIIDLKRRVVVSHGLVSGNSPPEKSVTGFEHGTVADSSIRGYLLGLPRR
jgi:hypothetical protein